MLVDWVKYVNRILARLVHHTFDVTFVTKFFSDFQAFDLLPERISTTIPSFFVKVAHLLLVRDGELASARCNCVLHCVLPKCWQGFCLAAARCWWVAARNSSCWGRSARRAVSHWSCRASRAPSVTSSTASRGPRTAGTLWGFCHCQGFNLVWFGLGWRLWTFRTASLIAGESVANAELFNGKCALAGRFNGMWEFASSLSCVTSSVGANLAPLVSMLASALSTVGTLGSQPVDVRRSATQPNTQREFVRDRIYPNSPTMHQQGAKKVKS